VEYVGIGQRKAEVKKRGKEKQSKRKARLGGRRGKRTASIKESLNEQLNSRCEAGCARYKLAGVSNLRGERPVPRSTTRREGVGGNVGNGEMVKWE
jgi:hypothetical protein